MTDTRTGQLRLEGLRKVFTRQDEQIVAVDDVSLQVEPGEFITLLGPSGCGKTTTLRIVAGFEHASRGHVYLDGRKLDALPPQKRPMAMVFQGFALFPHLSVRDNIAYGLRIKRRSRSEIEEAVQFNLISANLAGLAGRSPHELSGGQQQRVALARALAVQPAVLLFDEPLSNLDAKLRCSMRAEIRRIQQQRGITALYVTHDQDEAMSLSDRIVVMNNGRIEQVGRPQDVYLQPASVFVADFVGRANFVEVVPQRVSAGRARVRAFGREFDAACHEAVRAEEPAYLVVRPESVTLTPAHENTEEKVLSAVFRGATAEYEIETATGTLIVSAPRPRPGAMLGKGVSVTVELDEHRLYVLSKQRGASSGRSPRAGTAAWGSSPPPSTLASRAAHPQCTRDHRVPGVGVPELGPGNR